MEILRTPDDRFENLPDLPGFGKSDKPGKRTDYSYARYVQWMQGWLIENGLNDLYFA